MSLRRLRQVMRLDLVYGLRRPMTWILLTILLLMSFGMSSGHMRIASGDSDVGGTKAWLTSQFAVAQMVSLIAFMFYTFFVAVAAGLAIITDDEHGVSDLLRSTGLTAREYVWGKFLAVLTVHTGILAVHMGLMMLFNHVVPSAAADEIRGPFQLGNYLVPALAFAWPFIVFMAGASLLIGERTRRPVVVCLLPVALLVASIFFLFEWSPGWLDPRINQALMAIEPSGYRWLNETWLKVDRGVVFYNTEAIPFDAVFVGSRSAFTLLGLACVALAARSFARRRGAVARRSFRLFGRREAAAPAAVAPGARGPLLAPITPMAAPGFLRGSLSVARVEMKELKSHPSLYLFAPIILIQTLGTTLLQTGAFDTPLLATPGTMAVSAMNTLTLLVSLLLLFYTVESTERDRSSGLAPILNATPAHTASVLFGKALANSLVGAAIVLAMLLSCILALLVQGQVALDLGPFALVWGLFVLPTFLLWTAFVTALHTITRSRYATYALALGALVLTGWLQLRGKMNWAGNWTLWSVAPWTDMGPFQLDREALVLNRVLALSLTGFFIALTVRLRARVEPDASRTLLRLRPASLARAALGLLPAAAVPLVAGIALGFMVHGGHGGKPAEKAEKDYWRKNVATYTDAPVPSIAHVDLDVTLDPERRGFRSAGSYELVNHRAEALARFPVTTGFHWRNVSFTVDGKPATPEARAGLYVFTPSPPLPPGGRMTIGFSCEGEVPPGISKNGGGMSEFILPAGVVLTSFTPTFAPVLGYMEEVGVDEENRYDAKDFPAGFHEGVTEAFVSSAKPFTTRIAVTLPEAYACNSVGVLTRQEVKDGQRTVVWESDHPVSFFNVVAGRWQERREDGVAIYHHAGHAYNIDEMMLALQASRKHYGAWFHPYPWKELKLSEFPALASYAQGFPTNITFSEGIGFLTKNDPRSNATFMVTAHEAAHQWWGNILSPGRGPGGAFLSEGMSHFSTMLLFEEVKGPRDRMEFGKRLEDRYGDRRQKDSERPLAWVDGSRPGDTTTIYDRGGWAAWMLMQHMGRERMLQGLQAFVRAYAPGPDHALMPDFLASLRPFAPDPAAYDAFVHQWFEDTVVPEYRLQGVRKEASATGHRVTLTLENAGTGEMPVQVAATAGTRFPDPEDAATAKPYREARATVTLGAGAKAPVVIDCDFDPEEVVVDPDVVVLQIRRKAARAKL